MTGFILRRILQAIPTLLGASTLIFLLMQAAPGDATSIYLRPDIDPAVIEQMRKNLGLDQPIHVQYVRWLTSFAQGDFHRVNGFWPGGIVDHRPAISQHG